MNEVVILIATPSYEEGEKIARALVETRLAACVSVLPGVTSFFSWEGKLSMETEVLLIVKSKRELFQKLCEAVKKIHSYSVPEIIALPIVEGASDYLKWVGEHVG